MQKLKIAIFLSCLCLGLIGCSSMGKNKSAGPQTADSAAMSNGLGDQASFNGQDNGTSTALIAPHNQTYHFDFNDNQIQEEDKPSILAQARYLSAHPNARLLLTGHTDERGSREYNIALGERRALAVRDFLKMNGVAASQIRTVSYGTEQPVAIGHDEAAYQQNRRVELIYEVME